MRSVLIAGVGNLFLGDDAFGCEVTRRLVDAYPPTRSDVELRDFGSSIRALGYALAARTATGMRGTTVIVDAISAGAPPGTVQLFDVAEVQDVTSRGINHHAWQLDEAFTLARALGACLDGTYLLGCEPASFEPALAPTPKSTGLLTPPVEAAARRCVGLLRNLIEDPNTDLVALCMS